MGCGVALEIQIALVEFVTPIHRQAAADFDCQLLLDCVADASAQADFLKIHNLVVEIALVVFAPEIVGDNKSSADEIRAGKERDIFRNEILDSWTRKPEREQPVFRKLPAHTHCAQHRRLAPRYRKEIERLEEELRYARSTIIGLMPEDVQEILRSYFSCVSRDQSNRWAPLTDITKMAPLRQGTLR